MTAAVVVYEDIPLTLWDRAVCKSHDVRGATHRACTFAAQRNGGRSFVGRVQVIRNGGFQVAEPGHPVSRGCCVEINGSLLTIIAGTSGKSRSRLDFRRQTKLTLVCPAR